ncbi:high mobility group nucleosome-binding domain-containing protein 3-like [Phoca vitulina]|uniref:high mobility group nucleosome-binding domain-containing protein 3-like n=1 Tax=Phoca vitulina TaxID=9720 RepID=UPI00139639EB|nr:high mobility group nucleosome-binding domain-containing protein 3-like [Phoca vitulina]XP_035975443.1 high mobility group nucleosome-binding domain-containing protein 3-like [Halichoerus grypus]
MPQRKSPENTEGKGGSKATKSSARLSAKPAPPKPEPKPRKPSAHKEPGTKTNKGTKRKEGEHKAGKEGPVPSENGETKAEGAQKTTCRSQGRMNCEKLELILCPTWDDFEKLCLPRIL